MHEEHRGVRLPPELQHVSGRILEEYVRARLIQFAGAFARRINPTLGQQFIQQAAADAISSLPQPEIGRVAVENRDLQLVFRHDCLSLGCLDPQCVLCEHNPNRRCSVNFAPKYLVNDILKAKCDAPIRIEVIDRATGVPLGEDIPDVHLEMSIMDGNAYDTKCMETGSEHEDDLEACSLLVNNRTQPLLASSAASAGHNAASRVVAPLTRGMAQLPDLHVSDSSEAMLSGRKPPFRLLVRAVATDGRRISIRHAVSEGFVVATRRTRTAGKVEIPNVDDHVSKLEHMGKETVKKLQDVKLAAMQAGLDMLVPDNRVTKVGQFRKLALLAEADGHLRQKLQQLLKLSKEKWDDARDHAMRAVVADNRMRIWYADKASMQVGLLFTCRLGNVDLERPVGLLQKKGQEGAQTTMEATLMAQQTPAQREQVRQLQPSGVAAWWHMGHPGWAIYPVDSDQFMSTGALDSVNMQAEHIVAPMPPSPSQDGAPPSPSYMGSSPSRPMTPVAAYAPYGSEAATTATNPHLHNNNNASTSNAAMPGPGRSNPGVPSSPEDSSEHKEAPSRKHFRAPDSSDEQRNVSSSRRHTTSEDYPSGGPQAPPSAFGASHAMQQQQHHPQMPPPASLDSHQGDPATSSQGPSPFAHPDHHPSSSHLIRNSQGAIPMEMGNSAGLSNLAQIFGGPFSSVDFNKFQSMSGLSGFNLSNFPSLPQAIPSGDLEQFLQQHQASGEAQLSPGALHESPFGRGGMGRMSSYGMGKLELMELPDAAAAVAMLHDMSPEARAQAQAASQFQGAPSIARTNSGLQSMQSIEHALGTVEHDIMDKVTDDWMANQQPGSSAAPPSAGASIPPHLQASSHQQQQQHQPMQQDGMQPPGPQ